MYIHVPTTNMYVHIPYVHVQCTNVHVHAFLHNTYMCTRVHGWHVCHTHTCTCSEIKKNSVTSYVVSTCRIICCSIPLGWPVSPPAVGCVNWSFLHTLSELFKVMSQSTEGKALGHSGNKWGSNIVMKWVTWQEWSGHTPTLTGRDEVPISDQHLGQNWHGLDWIKHAIELATYVVT